MTTFVNSINNLSTKNTPFFFVVDYDLKYYDVTPLDSLPDDIFYSVDGKLSKSTKINFHKKHISKQLYKKQFDKIISNIKDGNTYLANLTSPTYIDTNLSLKEIYSQATSRFKLYYKDKFVCFSPEAFCSIKDDKIYTYPMKGTIDTKVPNALETILKDPKELAEHTMVVDLLRNDLSMVSSKVTVEKFRYHTFVDAGDKQLIQISSKISGVLPKNWRQTLGDILYALLPAGSITGTPKKKTIEILKNTEEYDRGFFTGVFGVFDGKELQSSVLIRYIEKQPDGTLVYKSGGGITLDSDFESEYQEMCDKVYI